MEEEKISNKVMISCREAGLLNSKKEVVGLNLYERIQLGLHAMRCALCKSWVKQSAELNKLIKNAFTAERHKMPEEKKDKIEQELDNLTT